MNEIKRPPGRAFAALSYCFGAYFTVGAIVYLVWEFCRHLR